MGGSSFAILIHIKVACRRYLLANLRILPWSIPMMDVVMLAIGFVFFALSIAYVYACDQL
jgi:hypothetical protein